jgi:hypothetical protein
LCLNATVNTFAKNELEALSTKTTGTDTFSALSMHQPPDCACDLCAADPFPPWSGCVCMDGGAISYLPFELPPEEETIEGIWQSQSPCFCGYYPVNSQGQSTCPTSTPGFVCPPPMNIGASLTETCSWNVSHSLVAGFTFEDVLSKLFENVGFSVEWQGTWGNSGSVTRVRALNCFVPSVPCYKKFGRIDWRKVTSRVQVIPMGRIFFFSCGSGSSGVYWTETCCEDEWSMPIRELGNAEYKFPADCVVTYPKSPQECSTGVPPGPPYEGMRDEPCCKPLECLQPGEKPCCGCEVPQ